MIQGSIRPVGDATNFNRAAWLQYIDLRPEFRKRPARQARNPFTGQAMLLPSYDDTAEVLLDDRVVGKVWWSMSEEPLVNVQIDPAAMSLLREWEQEMGGKFVEEDWG